MNYVARIGARVKRLPMKLASVQWRRFPTKRDIVKETIRYAFGTGNLGNFLVASSDQGLVAVDFGGKGSSLVEPLAEALRKRFPEENVVKDAASMQGIADRVSELIHNPASESPIEVDLRGSEFEISVWKALQKIPMGTMTTYGDLATEIGAPGRAQDVGAACAANTIAVVVPCHRVVRKDGTIAGYRWGIPRKLMLIEREQRALGFSLTYTPVDFKNGGRDH